MATVVEIVMKKVFGSSGCPRNLLNLRGKHLVLAPIPNRIQPFPLNILDSVTSNSLHPYELC